MDLGTISEISVIAVNAKELAFTVLVPVIKEVLNQTRKIKSKDESIKQILFIEVSENLFHIEEVFSEYIDANDTEKKRLLKRLAENLSVNEINSVFSRTGEGVGLTAKNKKLKNRFLTLVASVKQKVKVFKEDMNDSLYFEEFSRKRPFARIKTLKEQFSELKIYLE